MTDDPDTDDVNGNEQSVILTGVPKPIVIRCTGQYHLLLVLSLL